MDLGYILANQGELDVAADWFEENGKVEESKSFRMREIFPQESMRNYGDGYGYGDGKGYGKGDGYGFGNGDGYGDCDNYGDGEGDGDSYRDGKGDGDSYVDVELLKKNLELVTRGYKLESLIPGQLYLFMVGDGWTHIGRFSRPLGLFGAYFTDVVNLARTGPTSWPDLARGIGREGATYVSWKGFEMPCPKVINPFPWSGELPI